MGIICEPSGASEIPCGCVFDRKLAPENKEGFKSLLKSLLKTFKAVAKRESSFDLLTCGVLAFLAPGLCDFRFRLALSLPIQVVSTQAMPRQCRQEPFFKGLDFSSLVVFLAIHGWGWADVSHKIRSYECFLFVIIWIYIYIYV